MMMSFEFAVVAVGDSDKSKSLSVDVNFRRFRRLLRPWSPINIRGLCLASFDVTRDDGIDADDVATSLSEPGWDVDVIDDISIELLENSKFCIEGIR